MRPAEIYEALADIMNLTGRQRLLKRRTRNELLWRNRVQTARNHLVKRGLMESSFRGHWAILQKGQLAADQWIFGKTATVEQLGL